jgi:hypothetical protein
VSNKRGVEIGLEQASAGRSFLDLADYGGFMGAQRIGERAAVRPAFVGLLLQDGGPGVQLLDLVPFVFNDPGENAGLGAQSHLDTGLPEPSS